MANLGFEPAKFRRIAADGLAASASAGADYLSVVARSDVGANRGLARYTAENLAWLAGGGLRREPRFVAPMEALRMLGFD